MTPETAVFFVLSAQLLVIAFIDMRQFIIPNLCNLLLAISGVIAHWFLGSFDLVSIVAAVVVYCGTFALVRAVHFRARGHIGLGLGDVKMAASAGCWITVGSFPLFLAASSLSALAFVFAISLFWRSNATMTLIPFGPFIAVGLMMAWVVEVNSISILML